MGFSGVSWPPSSGGLGKLTQNQGYEAHFFESKIGFFRKGWKAWN